MENNPNYSTTIKSMPFLFLEVKKAASLKIQGLSYPEILSRSINDNIFQVNTESRKKEIAAAVIKRLKVLDDYLIKKIVNGSIDTGKQVALYALMKTDRLFYEFMQEVYREKCLLHDFTINDADFNIFFQKKSEQSEVIASWSDYTYYKMKQVYKRVLREAGLAKKQKKAIMITRPVVEKDLTEHLREIGDNHYLKAMLGE
ncbi:DUF1819 family protein [Desulfallas sp. Bu1-1]|uniref:DUF1819 family protein n=1 Tax=Desulfallas sp. Bu1-1 TaxID=2787620 RepID=UPI00189D933B|nr:DUF1819 family protein [Desulfallas sp. Bu1-1]MBF7082779.1 DUF1819 family protein [Desulfallas sp. Bu1-1]